MRRALLVVAAIVVLGAAIVALAPASLVGIAIERATDGALSLADTDGTVWRGRGTLGARQGLRVPLSWSLEALPLVRGEARVRIDPPTPAGSSPRAETVARAGALTLQALDVTLPAEAIEALAPRSGLRLTGDVRIASPSLRWTRTSIEGGARVDWRDARFGISVDAPISLGTVTANLAATGDRLAGAVTNEGGDFDVRGTLAWRPNGVPDVALTMTPRGGDPSQARSLAVTARPDGTGWNVEYRAGPR